MGLRPGFIRQREEEQDQAHQQRLLSTLELFIAVGREVIAPHYCM